MPVWLLVSIPSIERALFQFHGCEQCDVILVGGDWCDMCICYFKLQNTLRISKHTLRLYHPSTLLCSIPPHCSTYARAQFAANIDVCSRWGGCNRLKCDWIPMESDLVRNLVVIISSIDFEWARWLFNCLRLPRSPLPPHICCPSNELPAAPMTPSLIIPWSSLML